jgi:hypothetical protein
VPLTNGQIAALEILASGRDPESYVAGSTPLNRDHTRYSGDIDIFHDREERVAAAAGADAARLAAAGFTVQWQRQTGVHTLLATRDEETVKLEWVADSDFRFFPTVRDSLFGYMLHPVDLGANKTQAAANRRELRDIIDLVAVHETILPLGAVIWAAVEKAPGYTPEGLIAEIRRNSLYPAEEWRRVRSSEPIGPDETMQRLRAALNEAEAFVLRMPTEKVGRLFLKDGKVVQPDPDRLDEYVEHAGQRRGHWPSSPEIAAAMMERYRLGAS